MLFLTQQLLFTFFGFPFHCPLLICFWFKHLLFFIFIFGLLILIFLLVILFSFLHNQFPIFIFSQFPPIFISDSPPFYFNNLLFPFITLLISIHHLIIAAQPLTIIVFCFITIRLLILWVFVIFGFDFVHIMLVILWLFVIALDESVFGWLLIGFVTECEMLVTIFGVDLLIVYIYFIWLPNISSTTSKFNLTFLKLTFQFIVTFYSKSPHLC